MTLYAVDLFYSYLDVVIIGTDFFSMIQMLWICFRVPLMHLELHIFFCFSLVSETIPCHRDYRVSPQSNKIYLRKVDQHLSHIFIWGALYMCVSSDNLIVSFVEIVKCSGWAWGTEARCSKENWRAEQKKYISSK